MWVAFDPATKLIPALRLGSRTQDLAYALIHALSQVLAPGCLPVFTSDGLNLYFYALTAHFGQWFIDPTTGKTRWQVACDLLYGQVKKTYRRRRLYLVGRLMRLGDWAQFPQRLRTLGLSGSLNTAFVERLNLTLRHALAALSRRSRATAQLTGELLAHLECWRAYYHFCRPHLSASQARPASSASRRADAATVLAPHAHYGGWPHRSYLDGTGVVGFLRGLRSVPRTGSVYPPPEKREQTTALETIECLKSPLRALGRRVPPTRVDIELSCVNCGSTRITARSDTCQSVIRRRVSLSCDGFTPWVV